MPKSAERSVGIRGGVRKGAQWSGAILVGVGLNVTAIGAQALAVYNACFADPIRYPTGSAGDGWEGFFAVLAVGLVVTLVGIIVLESRARASRTSDG